MVGLSLYLDENGDMPSEKALRKRKLPIGELRRLGLERRKVSLTSEDLLLRELGIAVR